MKHKYLAGILLAGFSGLVIQTPALANKDNDTVIWATASQMDTTDIFYNSLQEAVTTALNMCDSLMHVDPDTKEYKPLLAESVEQVDPRTLDFTLRQGVQFWNGKELDAEDVAYTLNHVRQPDSGVSTRITVNWIEDVVPIDKYKVRIKAKEPTPAAFAYLSDLTPIYPKGHYDNAPALNTGSNDGKKDYGAVLPMCTGPFMLKEFQPGSSFTLVKNPNYFQGGPKGQPQIGTLIFQTIPDTDSQMASLITHDIDWMWSVLPENIDQLRQVPNVTVTPAPTMRMSFLSLDAAGLTGDTPLKDRRVRQAIAHAIDRPAIARDLVGPGAEVLKSICSPSQFGCTEDVLQYEYDPDKARALLAEAGYPDGFKMRFYGYRDRPYSEAVANYLRAVGIDTDLQFLQFNALLPKVRNREIPLAQLTWASYSLPDASISTGNYFEFSGDDLSRDEQVRDWLVKADHTLDPAEREALYKKALSRIADEAYFIPVVKYGRVYATDADLDLAITGDELGHFYRARWK